MHVGWSPSALSSVPLWGEHMRRLLFIFVGLLAACSTRQRSEASPEASASPSAQRIPVGAAEAIGCVQITIDLSPRTYLLNNGCATCMLVRMNFSGSGKPEVTHRLAVGEAKTFPVKGPYAYIVGQEQCPA